MELKDIIDSLQKVEITNKIPLDKTINNINLLFNETNSRLEYYQLHYESSEFTNEYLEDYNIRKCEFNKLMNNLIAEIKCPDVSKLECNNNINLLSQYTTESLLLEILKRNKKGSE